MTKSWHGLRRGAFRGKGADESAKDDRHEMSDKTFVPAARVDEVPAGEKKLVKLNGNEILLCHAGDGIYAIRNLCSHAYEPLECGRMRNGWIACPVHGARFDLATGAVVGPPAVLPIDVFEVRIVGDMIEVAV